MFAVFFHAVECWNGCNFSPVSARGMSRKGEMQLRWVMIIQSRGDLKAGSGEPGRWCRRKDGAQDIRR